MIDLDISQLISRLREECLRTNSHSLLRSLERPSPRSSVGPVIVVAHPEAKGIDLANRLTLRREEFANACGVALKTVDRWIRDGLPVTRPSGAPLILVDHAKKWLDGYVETSKPRAPVQASNRTGRRGRPRKS